jgi:prepilin-type N-terminal cleavage/methylation domain-containing protein/prepilin-type processing-associated H-X9-DG protein
MVTQFVDRSAFESFYQDFNTRGHVKMKVSGKRLSGFTLIELLVVISIIGTLASLLLPAVQQARESGRRSQCQNNLKQLGLAIHGFSDTFGYLPSSVRPSGSTALPRIAGLTLLLPYLEQQNLFDKYDQTKNWNDPLNVVVKTVVPTLICPSSPEPTRLDGLPELATSAGGTWSASIAAVTDYAPTIGVDQRLAILEVSGVPVLDPNTVGPPGTQGPGSGVIIKNAKPRFADVTDGLSNTILYAESAGRPCLYQRGNRIGTIGSTTAGTATNFINGGGWARPASEFTIDGATADGTQVGALDASDVLYPVNRTNGADVANKYEAPAGFPYYGTEGTSEVYAFHPGGANVALADGSVRLINESIPLKEFAALVTRSGHEEVVNSIFNP